MPITYSCIANGRAVLAELALTGGSYQEAAAKVLNLVLLKPNQRPQCKWEVPQVWSPSSRKRPQERQSRDRQELNHYSGDFCVGFLYLKVSDTFTRNPLMSQEHFFPSNPVAADFQQVLGQYMIKYNNNQDTSMISTRSQVIDIKNDMIQNVDIILEKEARLNIFLDGTDDPPTTDKEFQKTTEIPRRIWWKYFKKIVIITMAILSTTIILLSIKVIPP